MNKNSVNDVNNVTRNDPAFLYRHAGLPLRGSRIYKEPSRGNKGNTRRAALPVFRCGATGFIVKSETEERLTALKKDVMENRRGIARRGDWKPPGKVRKSRAGKRARKIPGTADIGEEDREWF